MKGFLISVIVGSLTGCVAFSGSTRDVSTESAVRRHVGREFTLQQDVFAVVRPQFPTQYALMRAPALGPLGLADPALPADVDQKFVGREFTDMRIVGVLHKGTRLRFVRILRYSAPTDGWFEIQIATDDRSLPFVQYNARVPGEPDPVPDDFAQKPWFFDFYAVEYGKRSG